MAGRTPPRYVPTLTEVVKGPAPAAPIAEGLSEEQMVHRIMQRVDLTLDRKLREAVATVILEHTRDIGSVLREEIELVVRQAVSQALEEELSAASRTARPGN